MILLSIICKVVTEHFHISRLELESPRRDAPLVRCRHVAMYLCHKMTKRSFPQIGRYLKRDHTSVMHGKDNIARAILDDADFALEVNQLEQRIIELSGTEAGDEQATMDATLCGGLSQRHTAPDGSRTRSLSATPDVPMGERCDP